VFRRIGEHIFLDLLYFTKAHVTVGFFVHDSRHFLFEEGGGNEVDRTREFLLEGEAHKEIYSPAQKEGL